MERNVPKLRFKGFNDEWKKEVISSICKLSSGSTPSKARKEYFNGTHLWVTSGELKNKYIYNTIDKITDKAIKNTNLKEYEIGSFIIAIYGLEAQGTRGSSAILGRKATISQACMAIEPVKDIYSEFLYYWYAKYGDMIGIRYAQGTKQQNLSTDLVGNLKIIFPSLKEQERITNFLTKVDKIIEKQDEKVKNLENYKKGLMQKIFSQEIRFKDENGKEYPEWQEYKLNELCNFFSGGTPLTSKKEYYDGNIPFIRSAEISSENTELTISEIGLNNSSAKMIQKGDLLYALYGATSGEVSISKLNGAINQAILCIRSNRCNLIFLEKVLRNSKQNIIKTYLQGGQGNLSANIIKELQYNFPCLDEQDKIAKFITKIDIILQKEIDKLNELYKWKKGLLQQMFV